MIQMVPSSFAILFILFTVSVVMNTDSALILEKVAFWSADSKLQLKEVCQHVSMNVLIMDVLRVQNSESSSDSNVLKMVQMSENKSEFLPFPHAYRFANGKGKGAVYADYLDVSGLGSHLAHCRQERNVRLLIRVRLEKEVKLNRRKIILLSALLWNSFMAAEGDLYDRPFGNEIRFDGFHFVYDKATGRQASILMKYLKEMAKNEGTELVLGSSNADYKFNSNEVIEMSDFIVTSVEPKTKTVPFVLIVPENKSSKLLQSVKMNKLFKGTMEILDKNGRLEGLKRLTSRNPKDSEEGSNLFIIAGLLGGSLVVVLITFSLYFYYRKLARNVPIKSLE